MFAEVAEPLHLAEHLHTFWPAALDPHTALPAAGVTIMLVDLARHLWRGKDKSPTATMPPLPPVSVTANPHFTNTPHFTNAPQFVLNVVGNAIERGTGMPGTTVTLVTERDRSKPISLLYPSLGPLFKGRDTFLRDLRASLLRAHGTAGTCQRL